MPPYPIISERRTYNLLRLLFAKAVVVNVSVCTDTGVHIELHQGSTVNILDSTSARKVADALMQAAAMWDNGVNAGLTSPTGHGSHPPTASRELP